MGENKQNCKNCKADGAISLQEDLVAHCMFTETKLSINE
jgi:hypothetical protein